jgi:peroxiredoxin
VLGADESLPFLVLSDEDRESFQEYGAWNEFDREPLHGIFLIDPNGRIRWAIRGTQPFLNMPFLLDEIHRLLDGPPETSSSGMQTDSK